jgi:hypothetical protein
MLLDESFNTYIQFMDENFQNDQNIYIGSWVMQYFKNEICMINED